ncbi:hypothetical protein B0O99DRAFT_638421 [Bisporella sp. PMI_857]|nr:hypothetical protein B0O99DRAFT_638421 [Bisporella sp. PMI_857]
MSFFLTHRKKTKFFSMTRKDLGKATKKITSWDKIKMTCELARNHNPSVRHAWVDTCCIDKTSSVELSEAINGMFRWYRNVAECFAYLRDLLQPKSGLEIDKNQLRFCCWFQREWTLQKLVALSLIDFYSNTWLCIGNKSQLRPLLSRITNIYESVLENIDYF